MSSVYTPRRRLQTPASDHGRAGTHQKRDRRSEVPARGCSKERRHCSGNRRIHSAAYGGYLINKYIPPRPPLQPPPSLTSDMDHAAVFAAVGEATSAINAAADGLGGPNSKECAEAVAAMTAQTLALLCEEQSRGKRKAAGDSEPTADLRSAWGSIQGRNQVLFDKIDMMVGASGSENIMEDGGAVESAEDSVQDEYLAAVTSEFGEDLDALRKEEGFDQGSNPDLRSIVFASPTGGS